MLVIGGEHAHLRYAFAGTWLTVLSFLLLRTAQVVNNSSQHNNNTDGTHSGCSSRQASRPWKLCTKPVC